VLMVTHEPDMAAYARRIVRFVDGVVAHDERNPNPVALQATAAQATQSDFSGEVGHVA
jgi:putative ABC transport system ATP-binding protein